MGAAGAARHLHTARAASQSGGLMKPRSDAVGRTMPIGRALLAALAVAGALAAGAAAAATTEQQSPRRRQAERDPHLRDLGRRVHERAEGVDARPVRTGERREIETPSAPGEFVPKLQAQAQANQVKWDLIDPGEDDVEALIQQGLLQKLPADLKAFMAEKVGKENVTDYGVSLGAYSDVIACNPEVAERCPANPQEFWDVREVPGPALDVRRRLEHEHPLRAAGRRRAGRAGLPRARRRSRLQEARPDQAARERVVEDRRPVAADPPRQGGRDGRSCGTGAPTSCATRG